MKNRKKLRIVVDVGASVTLLAGAVVALALAPEIGIAIAPLMISAAISGLKDARETYRKNPHGFFNRQRNHEDSECQVPSPKMEMN